MKGIIKEIIPFILQKTGIMNQSDLLPIEKTMAYLSAIIYRNYTLGVSPKGTLSNYLKVCIYHFFIYLLLKSCKISIFYYPNDIFKNE